MPRRTAIDLPEKLKVEARKAAIEDNKPFYVWVAEAIEEKLERRRNLQETEKK